MGSLIAFRSRWVLKFLTLLIGYIAFSYISLWAQKATGMEAQFWPAAGLALACILAWGYSIAPAIFLGTLIVHYINGDWVLPFVGTALGNTIEPMLGAYLCHRPPGFHLSLDRLRDAVRLVVYGAVVSTFVGTVIGVGGLAPFDLHNVNFIYFIKYWAGDSLGVLIITPLILSFATPNIVERFSFKNLSSWEMPIFIAALAGVSFLFSTVDGPIRLYLFFLLVVWTAMRLGERGATATTFVIAIITLWQTAMGVGPFAPHFFFFQTDLYQYLFVATLQLTGLGVASVVTEREIEREKAEAANKAKSDFVANVSHEIRTPLGVVLGYSELLSSNRLSASERFHYIQTIKRNGRQLSNVINDILDFSKMEAGQLDFHKAAVSVDEIIEDIKSTVAPDAEKKNIRMVFRKTGSVPRLIETDPVRLRQILLNVIGNAVKFTVAGEVDVKFDAVTDQGGLKLATIVTDTGIGIADEAAAEIFKPFAQSDFSSTKKFGGVGLGLVISRKLAQALGGTVVLSKSAPGRGSTFTITIDACPIPHRKPAAEGLALGSDIKLIGKRILIVDDSPDNQELISILLRAAGADVETADNGHEAVVKASHGQYDFILMDLQMPEMDGFEATAKIRADGYKGSVIALSAHAMKEVHDHCMASGFTDYLSKPIEKSSLLQALSSA